MNVRNGITYPIMKNNITTLSELRIVIRRLLESELEDVDEADELDIVNVDGEDRWDDHADPTGKEWHTGLEERRSRTSKR